MSDTITYQYLAPSAMQQNGQENALFLSKFSEIDKKEAPCFFWGKLTDSYSVARCLITLSNVVQSSFSLSPFERAKLKDPIVTSGNEKVRFEGFSHCAGVYARVDILPGGHDGEFLQSGTTNVDFNQPMISALSQVHRGDPVILSLGKKDVTIQTSSEKIVERKVPLPTKWIKGLASVQIFLSEVESSFSFNRMQALQLFQSLPTGKPKSDYFMTVRGNKPVFSSVKTPGSVCIGGVYKLRLIEPLIPLADELRVYPHPDMQSTTWQLYFGKVRFSLTISRDAWRGFSGEGAALESLIEDLPEDWIENFDKYSYANQAFNPALAAVEAGIDPARIDQLSGRLSAMGLLGFDIDENNFFYRQLPFKLSRILGLNPRMKDAEKLLADGKVEIVSAKGQRTEARVAGSGVQHTVILDGEVERCTCTWFSRHQGKRGPCKHLLAVKKKIFS